MDQIVNLAMFTMDRTVTQSHELTRTDLHQVDSVTRRDIGHARQLHEVDWLQGCSARSTVRELQIANCSSVQFSSSAVNTALVVRKVQFGYRHCRELGPVSK